MANQYRSAAMAAVAVILAWTGPAMAERIKEWHGTEVSLYSQPVSSSSSRTEKVANLPPSIEILSRERNYYKIKLPLTGETVFVHKNDVVTEEGKAKMDHASDEAIAGRVCASRGKTLNAPMGVAKGC